MIEVTAFPELSTRLLEMTGSFSGFRLGQKVNGKLIYLQSCRCFSFFFRFSRNDPKTGEACSRARFHSDQAENKANPHPSHHPTTAANQPQAALQSQPASAAQHTHSQDQSAKPAIQPPATTPTPGSQKASGGDG